ncbi:MAG TPA: diacylglycerol kinase family protein [Chloroflexota bacterium]|nr:diacylglycerol kinase family protein [Chloroflexota bacterium]
MRSLVVLNPVAGNGGGPRAWQRVTPALSAAGIADWECVTSAGIGHARELARAAAQAGCERVVAVGGDGTVCEVANGVARTQTAVAIVPTGTGNDGSRNLGIPNEPIAAARLALTGPIRAIDLGEIETSRGSTYFVNVAGFGFDAEVTARVNALPKRIGGTVPYVVGVLQTLWRFRAPSMRIGLDTRTVERRVFLVAVANCATYGGGMRIAPEAVPDDGLFDVCLVGDLSRLAVLRLIPKLYSGGHRSHSAVELLRCREVHAESTVRVSCQADGELVGDLPASFRIHPGGLRCVTGPP